MKFNEDETKKVRPILIVDNLSKDFGKRLKTNQKSPAELSKSEKILLTLIARIIVEIYIREEL